jgi:hypothetical protein
MADFRESRQLALFPEDEARRAQRDDCRPAFLEFFEKVMRAPFPLPLPANLVDGRTGRGRKRGPTRMIGTSEAYEKPMLIQADIGRLPELPLGYLLTGFWGHGVNSHAFYWVEATASVRVFFRLFYGGGYGDPDRDGPKVVRYLANWGEFVARKVPGEVQEILAFDSMGSGFWRFKMTDGVVARNFATAIMTADFDGILAEALATGTGSRIRDPFRRVARKKS